MRLRLLVASLFVLAACSGGGNQGGAGHDAAAGVTADSGAPSTGEDNEPDGAPWCPGPLADAGFSSLTDFPAASLCAGQDVNDVWESTLACQSFTLVGLSVGIDSGVWWLFDSQGDLVAEGDGGAGVTGPGCTGAVAGLRFPYQCFLNDGWPQKASLCPDAGRDAAASGDAADAQHE